ncbi:MAG: hypothetical protein Ta2F_07790 [Termitinemataceae bacterium]|nr:MAG: hypothetical protein Ta2F_07790 [Termitinemataceae bacterium]
MKKPNSYLCLWLIVFVFLCTSNAAAVDVPELIWRQSLGGNILCPPSYQLESVVAVCAGGKLIAFSKDGKLLWQYKAGGRLLPFAARSGFSTTYICRTNNILHAVNRVGKLLWQKNLKDSMICAPIIGWDERVFIFLQKKIMCLNARGVVLWKIDIESPLAFDAVPDKSGGIACILQDGTFLNISAFGMVHAVLLPKVPKSIVPFKNKYNDQFLIIYKDGEIDFFENTIPNSNFKALGTSVIASCEYNNSAAILLATGELVLWSPEAGVTKKIASGLRPKQNEQCSMQYNKDGITLLSNQMAIAFNSKLETAWSMILNSTSTLPARGDNILFVSGNDWLLYAYGIKNDDVKISNNKNSLVVLPSNNYGLFQAPGDAWDRLKNTNKSDFEQLIKTISMDERNGNIGENEVYYTKILLGMAQTEDEFLEIAAPENLQLRLQAIYLLGKIGSPEIIPFLVDLFSGKSDITIKTAAAEALGSIGMDPDMLALNAFDAGIRTEESPANEHILISIAKAVSSICRFSGPPLSGKGIPILIEIKNQTKSRLVLKTVQAELDALFSR